MKNNLNGKGALNDSPNKQNLLHIPGGKGGSMVVANGSKSEKRGFADSCINWNF